jgi:hypothetical protein
MMNKNRSNLSIASILLLEEVSSNLRIIEDLREFDDKTPTAGRASGLS